MGNIIFIIVAAIIVILAFIIFLQNKLACPKCGCKKLERTDNKKYKESHDL